MDTSPDTGRRMLLQPVDWIIPLAMGFGLAACAGLRAWLPLLILGGLARFDYLQLHPSFQFLERTDVLIILIVATILEILGDKIVLIDHILDSAGTVIRPAAGTVLVSSVLVDMPLSTAILLGIMVGGTTALGTHMLKSASRTVVTATAPVHGGIGNFLVSTGEDFLAVLGSVMAILVPVVAAGVILLWLVLRWRRRRAMPRMV